jgi:hypothetical protein
MAQAEGRSNRRGALCLALKSGASSISSMAEADAFALLPAEATEYLKGERYRPISCFPCLGKSEPCSKGRMIRLSGVSCGTFVMKGLTWQSETSEASAALQPCRGAKPT